MTRLTDSELQRYFDGELSPRRARRVHRLLAASPEDRQRLAALGELRGLLRARAEDVAEEASFALNWQRISGRIAADRGAPAGGRFAAALLSRRGLGAAAALAALVIAVVVAALLSTTGVARPRNDCVIETLEVGPRAVSTIFTIDDDGDAADRDQMTVIWVSEAADIEAGEGSPDEGM